MAYTGNVLELESSNDTNIIDECDVAVKIYDDELDYLNDKIELHNTLLITANVLKGIGIIISILVMSTDSCCINTITCSRTTYNQNISNYLL